MIFDNIDESLIVPNKFKEYYKVYGEKNAVFAVSMEEGNSFKRVKIGELLKNSKGFIDSKMKKKYGREF